MIAWAQNAPLIKKLMHATVKVGECVMCTAASKLHVHKHAPPSLNECAATPLTQ